MKIEHNAIRNSVTGQLRMHSRYQLPNGEFEETWLTFEAGYSYYAMRENEEHARRRAADFELINGIWVEKLPF